METKEAVFEVMANGPIKLSGTFRLLGSNGQELKTDDIVWLCRCGASANKPFCDGSHKTNGFLG